MLFYYLSRYCKSIKPRKAIGLFNGCGLSNKKSNIILSKAGVSFKGPSNIKPPFFFEFGRVEIHGGTYINAGCVFLDTNTITIGQGSLLGPHVTLTTVTHPVDPELRHKKAISAPIVIGENVWIGAGVVVLPGVTIGNNSVIAANSVVNSDVPSNVMYAGSPAVFKRNL